MYGTRLSLTGLGLAVFFFGFVFIVKFFHLYSLKQYFIWVAFLPPVSIVFGIISLFMRDQIKALAILTLIIWTIFYFPMVGPKIIPSINQHFSMNIPSGEYRRTPLHINAQKNNVVGLKKHLKKGNVDIRDKKGVTPLMVAAEYGSVDALIFLISNGANVHKIDKNGSSALAHSLRKSNPNPDIAKLLISNGATVNLPTSDSRWAQKPIERACNIGSLELFNLFLANGADVHTLSHSSGTLLHSTSEVEIAKRLIRQGVSPNARDDFGNTPLHMNRKNNRDVVELLIDNGAGVNSKNNNGRTPLHEQDDLDSLELLINRGADINVQDNEGLTPVQSRVHNNKKMLFLLTKGADPFSELEDGKTLLHVAVTKEIAQFLIDAGVDVNAKDSIGHSPLFYIMKDGGYSRKNAGQVVMANGGQEF